MILYDGIINFRIDLYKLAPNGHTNALVLSIITILAFQKNVGKKEI